jgi:g-D-glutamyl-meso-diaminopimelate peptidase
MKKKIIAFLLAAALILPITNQKAEAADYVNLTATATYTGMLLTLKNWPQNILDLLLTNH